mgnify:CR=1 FL=1
MRLLLHVDVFQYGGFLLFRFGKKLIHRDVGDSPTLVRSMYPSRISCSLVTLTGIALSSPVIAEALGVVRYAQSQAPPTNTISTSTAMIGYQFSSLLRVVFTMIPFDM